MTTKEVKANIRKHRKQMLLKKLNAVISFNETVILYIKILFLRLKHINKLV